MRRKREILGVVAAGVTASILGAAGFVQPAGAATLQWDADGATPGILDGAGIWSTAGNWYNAALVPPNNNQNWVNTTSDAVFGGNGATGTPGIVTLSAATTAASITFNVAGYTIQDGSTVNRLILPAGGGLTVNENATIKSARSALLMTGTQTWTIAPGRTLTFDTTLGADTQGLFTGGTSANLTFTVTGGGNINFVSDTDAFALNVTQTNTMVQNAGYITATGRASDGAALVVRSRSDFLGNAGKYVLNGGTMDVGTGLFIVQQNGTEAVPTGPTGVAALNGGLLIAGGLGGAGLSAVGQIYLNGGEVRATRNNELFAPVAVGARITISNGASGSGGAGGTGGGTIDTNGFDISIERPLLEDAASTGGGFIKKGAGTLTFGGNSTYTGGTTINAGTLKLGSGGTAGSILGNVLNNGTLAFNRSDLVTFAGTISGTGGITHVGPGTTLITSVTNSFTGETRVTGGTLDFNDNATFATTSGIVVNANGAAGVETSSLDPAFIAKINSGSGPSVGAIALAAVNSAANIDFTAAPLSGTNSAGMSVGAIGSINYTGTITPNAAVGYRVGGGGTLTLPNANALTGAHNVTVTNGGTVVVGGTNDYSGATTIDGLTTLSVGNTANLGDGGAGNDVVLNGGKLLTTGGIASTGRDISVTAAGGTIDTAGNDSAFGNVAGPGNLSKISAGKLTVNHVRVGNLNLAEGTLVVAPDDTAAGVSKVATLTLGASAEIDLGVNKLITASPLGTWTGAAYDGVAGLVDTGRGNAGNALWDGTNGLITTDTRAINNNDLFSIGTVKVSSIRSVDDTATATFAGQTVLGSDTIAMVTWGGDANLDGKINIDDYGQIDSNVSKSGTVFGWNAGDFNYDGKINIDDYGIIDGNINRQTGTIPTGGAAASAATGWDGVAAVPEPASLSMLAVAATWMIRRRRTPHFTPAGSTAPSAG